VIVFIPGSGQGTVVQTQLDSDLEYRNRLNKRIKNIYIKLQEFIKMFSKYKKLIFLGPDKIINETYEYYSKRKYGNNYYY